MNLLAKQKEIHRLRKQTHGHWGWRGGDFRKVMNALLCLEWLTNGNLLDSTGNSARGYVPAWMGGEFGEGWIHVYVWLSPFTVHLKLQHC